MKSIKDQSQNYIDLKKTLLRLDLNVPLKNSIIQDTTRIDKIIPTLLFLLKNNSKVIIISHIGRPKGKIVENLSLKPVAERLEKILSSYPIFGPNQKIRLIKKNVSQINSDEVLINENEKIIMLENIRFSVEEENNDTNFAKKLSTFGDIYVNDAFSRSHRAHASIDKITNFLPSYSGIQFEKEVSALKKITSEIKKPISCILGGSKISSKIGIIKNLIPKLDNIIIVGSMANNFLEYNGYNIGKSFKEKNCKAIIDEIYGILKNNSCSLIYPTDVSVGKSLLDDPKVKEINNIENDDMVLDIGPKTINQIKNIIEKSNSLLWNGPAGYFENSSFSKGTNEIAKKIIDKNKNKTIYSVAGGGDTIAVLNQLDAIKYFNFVSTAGGAFLEYLEGKMLPGIKALG